MKKDTEKKKPQSLRAFPCTASGADRPGGSFEHNIGGDTVAKEECQRKMGGREALRSSEKTEC